jgi:hypothetical protein
MKTLNLIALFVIALNAFTVAAEEFDARLEMSEPVNVTANEGKNDPKNYQENLVTQLQDGKIRFYVEPKGKVFASRASIKIDGHWVSFIVPKEAYSKSDKDKLAFEVPANTTGQGIGIKVELSNRPVEEWQELKQEKCKDSYLTTNINDKSELRGLLDEKHLPYTVRHQKFFKDMQWVVVTKQSIERGFTGTLNRADGKVIGSINPAPAPEHDTVETGRSVASACGGKLLWSEKDLMKRHAIAPNAPAAGPTTLSSAR